MPGRRAAQSLRQGNPSKGAPVKRHPDVSQRMVAITVYSKSPYQSKVFECDIELLCQTMKYFTPIVQKRLNEEQEALAVGSASTNGNVGSATSLAKPIALKVKCDLVVFRWLKLHMEGKDPQMTSENVVSIVLASNFLQMQKLMEEGLLYMRDHLIDVLLSGVDMKCLPGDLLGHFCSITGEIDVARCMLELYKRGEQGHANRSFLASVLCHMVHVNTAHGDASHTLPRGAAPLLRQGHRNLFPGETNGMEERFVEDAHTVSAAAVLERAEGLRWCHLCGILFDEAELLRLARLQTYGEPVCPGLSNHCMTGPRGERWITHAASRVPVTLEQPTPMWSSTQLERWAWRVLGSRRFVYCTHCKHLVLCIDTPSHVCATGPFNFLSADGSEISNSELDDVATWMRFAAAEDIYTDVGGLVPIYASPEAKACFQQEHITVENAHDKSKCSIRLPAYGNGERTDVLFNLLSFQWAAQPAAVWQTINAEGMDTGVLNYHERDMMWDLTEHLRSLAPVSTEPQHLRSIPLSGESAPLSGRTATTAVNHSTTTRNSDRA